MHIRMLLFFTFHYIFTVNVQNAQPDVACIQHVPINQIDEGNGSFQNTTGNEMKSIKKLWTPMPLSPPSILPPLTVITGYNNSKDISNVIFKYNISKSTQE